MTISFIFGLFIYSGCDYQDGSTPLHIACQHGHTEVVRSLQSDRRVDINKPYQVKGSEFCSCVLIYVMHRSFVIKREKVVDSLPIFSIDLHAILMYVLYSGYEQGATPLYYACLEGHTNVVKALLSNSKIRPNRACVEVKGAKHCSCITLLLWQIFCAV